MLWILCFSRVLLYILRAASRFTVSGTECRSIAAKECLSSSLSTSFAKLWKRPAPREGTNRPSGWPCGYCCRTAPSFDLRRCSTSRPTGSCHWPRSGHERRVQRHPGTDRASWGALLRQTSNEAPICAAHCATFCAPGCALSRWLSPSRLTRQI